MPNFLSAFIFAKICSEVLDVLEGINPKRSPKGLWNLKLATLLASMEKYSKEAYLKSGKRLD